MKIIDVSWPLSPDMTGYRDRTSLVINQRKQFDIDGVRESSVTIDSHAGTHIDAPSHFIADGASVDNYQLSRLIGSVVVVDATHEFPAISAAFCAQLPDTHQMIFFKTRNSKSSSTDRFNPEFIFLEAEAAALLAKRAITAIGIDYLGIERGQQGHPTHRALLEKGIAIIEGLRLSHVNPGVYTAICLPLAVIGLEAAPARVVLLEK